MSLQSHILGVILLEKKIKCCELFSRLELRIESWFYCLEHILHSAIYACIRQHLFSSKRSKILMFSPHGNLAVHGPQVRPCTACSNGPCSDQFLAQVQAGPYNIKFNFWRRYFVYYVSYLLFILFSIQYVLCFML